MDKGKKGKILLAKYVAWDKDFFPCHVYWAKFEILTVTQNKRNQKKLTVVQR